jgi:hypothetical protein
MGELIDFAMYKKQKEEKEVEKLMKQVEDIISQDHPEVSHPQFKDFHNVTDLFYGAPIYPPNSDDYSEWLGTEDKLSYYPYDGYYSDSGDED